MHKIALILLLSWMAGLASFAGACIARWFGSGSSSTERQIVHGVVAFGGGLLVAAIAFALVPKGIENLDPLPLALSFAAGGVVFWILDAFLARRGGSRAQFMAMLMDFLPEAVSMGAVFGHDPHLGMLLALFIGAQNLPEGFNAFRELMDTGARERRVLWSFFLVSLLGPLAAGSGLLLLRRQSTLTALIMTFAAGGILYLVFQDIAPQSKMRRHWTPPLGAVLGFIVGMLAAKLLR